MAQYLRIRSVVKTERTGAHERIKAICGLRPDGSHWTLTHEDAVSQVENGICALYIERPRGQRYDVIVATVARAHKYLKTDADRDQLDQLLFLPDCHHFVHTLDESVLGYYVASAYVASAEVWGTPPNQFTK